MSELASAMFSIADANEFRFARFYIVCEAVPLGAPESPLLSAACRTHPRGVSKRGQDTEETGKSGKEEILAFCFKESSRLFFAGTPELRSLTRITGTTNLRCLLPQYLSLPQLFFYSVALSVTVSVSVSCTVVVNRLSNVTFAHTESFTFQSCSSSQPLSVSSYRSL